MTNSISPATANLKIALGAAEVLRTGATDLLLTMSAPTVSMAPAHPHRYRRRHKVYAGEAQPLPEPPVLQWPTGLAVIPLSGRRCAWAERPVFSCHPQCWASTRPKIRPALISSIG